jgi:hypothetical protein
MRLFQNIYSYPAYRRRLDGLAGGRSSFGARITALVSDGYNGVHLLDPIVRRAPDAFLACASDGASQAMWAKQNGMRRGASEEDILIAQVEAHRSEVFYTQNPAAYGPRFLKRLPGCVRAKICWHSPPAKEGDLSGFDLVINNFPSSLEVYAKQGVKTAYFAPSYDPAMQPFSENRARDIDVVFAGGFSRYHMQRAEILEDIASLSPSIHVVYALDRSRLTRLAESAMGWFLPLRQYRRSPAIRAVSTEPVFGSAMYRLFSRAKIVLNGAVDAAGSDRGNMRCFEAMGCGAVMVSDTGNYPPGLTNGRTIRTYARAAEARAVVLELLSNEANRQRIALDGLRTMRGEYSKEAQWKQFVALVDGACTGFKEPA